ncbi:glycosyltransferase [Bosea sp. NPDC055594]
MKQSLSFSIVINTYNRAVALKDTLASLNGLQYDNFEVIVVNGPSTDATASLMTSYEGKVKLLSCPDANLSMSRNIGIEAASGDIVAFIDDDAAPHPTWLEELALCYADKRVGGVGGFTVDNSGINYQACKTICDRFGNAFSMSAFFDERPLCFSGSPAYPSLLGTNSSFRLDVLKEVGGFDHTFRYFLDETDVCLRVVDAGYQIVYAPQAIVYHQFAESHIRSPRRIPKTLFPSAVSKSYFIMRHGSADVTAASNQLDAYKAELYRANAWLEEHGEITKAHRSSLDQDVASGTEDGATLGMRNIGRARGDLNLEVKAAPFLPFPSGQGLRIALVSQAFPPSNDAGIARWTSMMAIGLAAKGHSVHVIARASESPSVEFKHGYWLHRIMPDHANEAEVMAEHDVPPHVAAWAAAVKAEVSFIKSFGLDALSFPIWDVEGTAVADDPDIGVVMSLHTSYKMALPFKREWQLRPLHRHLSIDKIIRNEKKLLGTVPVILANSNAIIADLEREYEADFSSRAILAPHGTWDPFETRPSRLGLRAQRKSAFEVGYVGRFEERKGFDIAARALSKLVASDPHARVIFAGDDLNAKVRDVFIHAGAENLLDNDRVEFRGLISRDALDDLFCTVDTVLMPSRYESFGLVAIEAMAGGASVVALAAGGLKEVVTSGTSGYLVPVGPEAAELCGEHLIRLSRDRELREKLGRGARSEFESRFTVATMVEQALPAYYAAARRAKEMDHQC